MKARTHKIAGEATFIDPSWVRGIRLWVKKVFVPKPRYETLEGILAHLKILRDKELNKFWEHLFYTKGLLPRGEGYDGILEDLRTKLQVELKSAREVLNETIYHVEDTLESMTPGTYRYQMDQKQDPQLTVLGFYQRVDPKDPFGAAVKGYEDLLKERLGKVEDILSGKLLRAITAFLSKHADGIPFENEEILLEYNIGNMKLVYDGLPDPYTINKTSPANPRNLSDYIPYFKKAKGLLDQKGLGGIWYGTVFVGCPQCGGENPLGKHFGVGAHYFPHADRVVVYLEPKPFMVELLIHELGHRYFYKFMGRGDRLRFDSYFNEVKAVSEYGSTDSAEDFAEVFAHFVMGKDMTRDQVERFKAFLAKKDRGRFASSNDVAKRYLRTH